MTPRLTTVSRANFGSSVRVVDGVVQAAALAAEAAHDDDELGDGRDVAQLEQVARDEVLPVVLADLLLRAARCGAPRGSRRLSERTMPT